MREKDPSKLEKCDEIMVRCYYLYEIDLLKKCYPEDAKLMEWPYSGNQRTYIVTIMVYGEYCKLA